MSESYNASEELSKPTFFNHLMLESEVSEMTGDKYYNPKELIVDLKINGVQVSIGDFNKSLENWSDRIADQIKESLNYMSKDEAVIDNAKAMLKEKLGNAYEILAEIENSEWKLNV